MSELDFLLNRRKGQERRPENEDSSGTLESRDQRPELAQGSLELKEKSGEPRAETEEKGGKSLESEGGPESLERREEILGTRESNRSSRPDRKSVESIMSGLLSREPKIGVWSYPSFLVLQYLFNTKPGFRMSKIAKEAMEIGLKQLYPELFAIAEALAKERGLIK